MSHPIRDAWIEICPKRCRWNRAKSRIPYGMRGLKSLGLVDSLPAKPSHPIRDAWIEIIPAHPSDAPARSHPIRDAWIEIVGAVLRLIRVLRRIPYGMRGLK